MIMYRDIYMYVHMPLLYTIFCIADQTVTSWGENMYNGKRHHNCPELISLSVFSAWLHALLRGCKLYLIKFPISTMHTSFLFRLPSLPLCIVEMFYLCNLTDNLFVLYCVLLPSQVVKIIEVPIVVWYLTTLKHTPAILICQGIDSIYDRLFMVNCIGVSLFDGFTMD